MPANKQNEENKEDLYELIRRVSDRTFRSNAKGTLKEWTGKGYSPIPPWVTQTFGSGLTDMMGRNKFASRLAKRNASNSDPEEQQVIELVRDLQEMTEKQNKAFTGASFSDKQLDFIRSRVTQPWMDSDQIVSDMVVKRLNAELGRRLMNKTIKLKGSGNEERFLHQYPQTANDVKKTAYDLSSSKQFADYTQKLIRKYTTEDKKGKRPDFQESDFNPYIYAADYLNDKYSKASGGNFKLTDVIDQDDFGADELPKGLINREMLMKLAGEKFNEKRSYK